uniref:Uncharacterized protein n=1 Tax=Trichobilharzia regenti TaxID=157069 RepID=A0AA85J6G0_TRIRE|nr:unnamed protein product [Trichobilharzia regenti]
MVTRDVNVRLNVEERVKERLCFKKPTVAQMKRLSIPAQPFIEPLSQLQEFQEYNKIESVHKRARKALAKRDSCSSSRGEKFRRLMPFERDEPMKRVVPQRVESPFFPEDEPPLIVPDAGNELLTQSSVQRSHPYGPHPGVCATSQLLDEVASYEERLTY